MKEKIFAILISLFTIVAIVGFNHNEKQDVIINNGVKYAIKLNSKKANSFPVKGKYNVIVNCDNANAKWDYDNWTLNIYNINAGAACDINFIKIDNYPQLNDKIMSLQGNKQIFNENGFRYEGKNPDNYILYNNELWRIIGVFDTNIPNVGNQDLVKIIRNESIGGLSWHEDGRYEWPHSKLIELLNGAYLNAEDGTKTNYCYGYGTFNRNTLMPSNCDYRVVGIQPEYREMIENVTWYLGSPDIFPCTTNEFYVNERRDSRKPLNGSKIGLMYVSDYGYSVMSDTCNRDITLENYNSNNCAGQSWLYGQSEEWTMIYEPSKESGLYDVAYNISDLGCISTSAIGSGYAVRPVLYLKSNVYTKGGDGTLGNPYVIGLDDTNP